MKYSHSEVKTGIVVLAALAVLLALIIILGNFEDLFREKYRVVFLFSQVAGLREGAPVRYGGVDIGYVSHIDDRVEQDEQGNKAFLVELHSKIDGRYKLTSGDQARIGSRITGDVWVEVVPGAGDLLRDGDELRGAPGYTLPELQDKLVYYMDSIEVFFRENKTKVAETIDNVQKATEELKASSESFKELLEVDAKAAISDAKDAAADIKDIVASKKDAVSSAVSNFEGGARNFKEASSGVKEIVEANKGRIDAVIANLEGISKKLSEAADTIEEFSTTSRDVLLENRANIKRTVANLRDTAANLKFTSDDLRRNPWKLLRRPKKQEMDEWAIYAAAVDFSKGAQNLSEAFYELSAAVSAQQELTPEQAQQLKEVLGRTKELLEDFSKYEESFYKKLTGK